MSEQSHTTTSTDNGTVTIRWHEDDHLTILANGRTALTVSSTVDHPDEPTLGPVYVASIVAEDLARALGLDVRVERP
jgi:hypothetical protein